MKEPRGKSKNTKLALSVFTVITYLQHFQNLTGGMRLTSRCQNFWDKVNRIYAQKSVSVPIFGSGITRIKGHKSIDEEDLLKIMLWTFRISEMRFKHPAKLTIIIHESKIDKINLLELKTARNGL